MPDLGDRELLFSGGKVGARLVTQSCEGDVLRAG
jgi:hypothetical protein